MFYVLLQGSDVEELSLMLWEKFYEKNPDHKTPSISLDL